MRKAPAPPPLDLDDRRAFDPRIPFEPVEDGLHYRTPDGRWSLHRRRITGGITTRRQATTAYVWDLVDNADPEPAPAPLDAAALDVAVLRARRHIRTLT